MKDGVNVLRLNFSHGDHIVHGDTIRTIKKLRKKLDIPVGIMLDTKGPEIRTGVTEKPIVIHRNEQVLFTHLANVKSDRTVIQVNHAGFIKDAKNAKLILLDNGTMEFHIDAITPKGVLATTKDEGSISSRRHVNIPGAEISLPSFTKKDWDDIGFGVTENVDFIAPSFIRNGKDIRELRAFLEKKKSRAMIIAKVETAQAVEHIHEIIAESDGIMVARGDLGSEIPFERVPKIQDEIVRECIQAGKIVIVATQMLESMIENPMPTRAEVTDVAHAAATRADTTMLSGETAAGQHPFRAVSAMHRILVQAESATTFSLDRNPDTKMLSEVAVHRLEQGLAACVMAQNLHAKAIVVITKTGQTARSISRFRAKIPVIAFTDMEQTQHQLAIAWGVHAHVIHLSTNFEKTIDTALALLVKKKLTARGDTIILATDIQSRASSAKDGNHVMTVQIRKL